MQTCNPKNYTKGRTKAVEYLVIHYTANDGDTAEGNCRYFQRSAVGASAHYFVDETQALQSVADGDTAWHCGAAIYRHGKCRNANSIGIELCSRKRPDGSYYFAKETVRRAAELTLTLMERYGLRQEHVLRHYDVTGKCCPAPFVLEPGAWRQFLQMLRKEEKQVAAKSAPSSWAQDAAKWAVEKQLIQGDAAGDCQWQAPLTREAMVVVLQRLAKLLNERIG